jgi:hypothetical protein
MEDTEKKTKEPACLNFFREEREHVWFFKYFPDAQKLAQEMSTTLLNDGWHINIKQTPKRISVTATKNKTQHSLRDIDTGKEINEIKP